MADDYGFVGGKSPETARRLLELAAKQNLEAFVVRSTVGGYYVPIAVAKEYEATLGAPAKVEAAEPEGPSEPDDSWTVANLKAWAQDNEVDLGDATKKADILAVIRSADKEE